MIKLLNDHVVHFVKPIGMQHHSFLINWVS